MLHRVQTVVFTAVLAVLLSNTQAETEQQAAQAAVLFQNVRIFDGKRDALSAPSNVLVRGNKIAKISTDPIEIDKISNGITIDGAGAYTPVLNQEVAASRPS
jgi:hypothetical protein